ncbi:MAG: MFS transporter [Rhodobacteraceae bacterium]|nr:MFS transporter [Paracoccaceae bacterium]
MILTSRFALLYAAQCVALLGTGLLTIALALLAFDLAGAEGGLVLGFALTLKMIAYVTLAPLANAFLGRLPRRGLLITLDLIRAAVALILPFVTEIWQIYALVFVLQASSAAFTPAFQATIPDILPDEDAYTKALSLTRLAQEIENIASPALAGALLLVIPSTGLFAGTALGFLGSALLIWRANPPRAGEAPAATTWQRIFAGTRCYLAAPELRGLLALTMAAAAGSAMIIVNTAVIVGSLFGRGKTEVALATGAFGLGAAAAALVLPRALALVSDRRLMIAAAAGLAVTLIFGSILIALAPAFADAVWSGYLLWMMVTGFCYSAILTPTGRVVVRNSGTAGKPALFAAQFALSHACWLITYPLAGWLGSYAGMTTAAVLLGLLAAAATLAATRLWTVRD